ncbi:MAG: Asp23/Gls24 family envelope stress response protein [Ruminococcus sp.]|nr:Asp23/Gls24 family envelope stress response protein [Ruminococcus sp.]
MIILENHIGRISVSAEYLTEIVRHTVCDCFGVADMCSVNTFRTAVSSITKGRFFRRRGVVIHIEDDGTIAIDLHIKVSYGTSITAVTESIGHKVSFTVEEITGIRVSCITIYVDDMNI